jgi:uncharacterized linocin/CFP29 family protein
MDHLLRGHAPLTESNWQLVDSEAKARLTVALSARKLVDFAGPFGWEYSATNLGRVGAVVDAPEPDVIARARRVLPLTEVRADFSLSREELMSQSRGAIDVDLGPLDAAALRIATVENAAVFRGWDAAGIVGVATASTHPALRHSGPDGFAEVVATAVATLKGAGVGGPYGLAVGPSDWIDLIQASDHGGYPLLRHLESIIEGPVEWTPGIEGCIVLSQRGGDFVLEVGEDLAIGYASHDAETVGLYLEESLSFRVATPEAAIAILPA